MVKFSKCVQIRAWLAVALIACLSIFTINAGCPFECCPSGDCMCGYANCDYLGLSRIPSGYWPNIKYIELGNNRISELTDLSGFPNIKTIYLQFNRLSTLDLSKFPANNSLDNIYATNNKISSIKPPPPGIDFPYVTSLFLSNNDIVAIRKGDLDGFSILDYVILETNPLMQLDVEAVDGKFKGGSIFIGNTPLACTCGYKDLVDWGKANKVKIYGSCMGEDVCGF